MLERRETVTLRHLEIYVKVVETGLGIACVSCKAIEKRINDGLIKEIKIDDIKVNRDLYLIYHKDKFISRNLKIFIDKIKNSDI